MVRRLIAIAAVGLFVLAAGVNAEPGRPQSALAALERARPGAADSLDEVTRAILARVTPAQLDALRAGTAFDEISLGDGRTLAEFLEASFGTATYSVPWSTIDGGGGTSSGGAFSVVGTIGQPDAGSHADGTAATVVLGGYWGPRLAAASQFFGDGFETGDLSRWTATLGELP